MAIFKATEDRNGYDLQVKLSFTVEETGHKESLSISIINIPLHEIAQEIEAKFSTYEFSLAFESIAKEVAFRKIYCVSYFDLVKIINEFSNEPIPEDTIYIYAIISMNLTKDMKNGILKDNNITSISVGNFSNYEIREDVEIDNAIAAMKSTINNPKTPILFGQDTRMCSLFILAEIVNTTQSGYVSELISILGNRLSVQITSFRSFDPKFSHFIKNMNMIQANAFLSILKARHENDFYDIINFNRENMAYICLAKLMPLINDNTIATSPYIESKGLSNLKYVEMISRNFISSAYGDSILKEAEAQVINDLHENISFSKDSLVAYQAIAIIQGEDSIPLEVRLALDGFA